MCVAFKRVSIPVFGENYEHWNSHSAVKFASFDDFQF